MGQTVRPGNGPGERHGQRKGHRIGAPACSGGKGDNHGQKLKQNRQEEVGNALAQLVNQKNRAPGLGIHAADGNGQQQDHRAEHHASDAVVKPGHEFLERHALGQRHAHRQQQGRAKRPMHIGRIGDNKGADGNADQRAQRQEELQHMRCIAGRHMAGLQFPGAQRLGPVRVKLTGGAGAVHGRGQALAQEKRLLYAEQKRAEHGENGIETKRDALKEKADAVCFRRQKTDPGNKDKRLHITRPGIKRQL